MAKIITLVFSNRDEWREWLDDNHQKENEAWLTFYKKTYRKNGRSL